MNKISGRNMEENEQQLFLAEFLVDTVKVPSVRAVYADMIPAITCVSFQILNLPAINIYQQPTSENCLCVEGDAQVFKKGKSCLFALPSKVLEKPLHTFPITMSVYKKLPPGVLPDVMLIGTNQIETNDLVNALLSCRAFNAGNPCRSMKEAFTMKTATGQHVGEVTAFIRISCFGTKIVTQFQMPHNEKPYLFKGAQDSPVFQCKRIPSNLESREAANRCNCQPSNLKPEKNSSGEAKRKTCCPPPCPPPSRKRSPTNFSPRPCCPSNRSDA